MTMGIASIRGTAWFFLFYGLSHQRLRFSSDGAERTVIESGDVKQACECRKCGIVTILQGPPPIID